MEDSINSYPNNNFNKPEKVSYEDWGYRKAENLNGSNEGLLKCLRLIMEDHKHLTQNDKNMQRRLKEAHIAAMKSNEEQKDDKLENSYNLEQKLIWEKVIKIEEIRKEINEIRRNPASVMPDKLSKVGFIVGLLILVSLTVYLFIFYSSASYSAFFKIFSVNDLGVASSIFDPKAISQAYKDGVIELLFILSIPFVFISLGCFIHQSLKGKGPKKYFQIISLFLIPFMFNAILAYEIDEKIYNIKTENSYQDILPYNFDLAFQSVDFWLIIIAGFVVYLIWGFVFDYTLKSYDKLDVTKQEIKIREDEISHLEKKLNTRESIIGKLNDEIIADTSEFSKILQEFLRGWMQWMKSNKFDENKCSIAKRKAYEFLEQNIQN